MPVEGQGSDKVTKCQELDGKIGDKQADNQQ